MDLAKTSDAFDIGIEGGACFTDSEDLLPIDPGTRTFVVYKGSDTKCRGAVIARSAPVTVAAGETYLMVPIGERIEQATVKAVKLRR